MTRCPYCGNSSGRRDSRGMCASCGGDIGSLLETRPTDYSYPYSGQSGGFMILPMREATIDEIAQLDGLKAVGSLKCLKFT